MKKKFFAFSAAILSMAIIAVTFLSNNPISLSLLKADNTYSLIFDDNHNDDYTPHKQTYFYSFTAYTERGTEITFFEQNLYDDNTDNWKYVTNTGGLLNTTKIGGLSSIQIEFSKYGDSEYDEPEIRVKYGWVVGAEQNGNYQDSPLNKYEQSLASGEIFNFDNLHPSYFYLYFSHVYIESIHITFTCEESIPAVDNVEHYELVTSLSDISQDDIYAISSTCSETGYMMSTAVYNTTDITKDKIRGITSVSPTLTHDIEYSDSIMQLKITQESDLYYFQAQNYLGTYEDGYFSTGSNGNNELFILPSENKTGFTISMDENYLLNISCTVGSYTKYLRYFHDTSTAFNCYTKGTGTGKYLVYLYKYVDVQEESFTLDYSKLTSMSKSYASGNYGTLSTFNTSFEYYRTVRASNNSAGYAFLMKSPNFYYSDNGYPSSFYNLSTSPIYGIKKIEVTYKATSGIKIEYSKDIGDEYYSALSSSANYVTNSIVVDKMNFFKIMTNGSDAYIKDITITYTNKTIDIASNTSYTGTRKEVTPYSGSLTDGVSQCTMYISPSLTKTYTYYSKQYAYNNINSIDKDEVFMIDPVDVCNYYLAFHEFPANYVTSGEKSTYGSAFGSYARQVSTYTRTDGYATKVPYNNRPGQSTPIYYELDIDVDGTYSLSSRQVGRVVVWQYGFSCYTDGSSVAPVCTYTDDHYATFQEYDCMGGFSVRFNGERSITNKVHTPLSL